MAENAVAVSREDGIATITIDRAKRYNSFDVETIRALQAAVEDVAYDDAVVAVVLTGSDRYFCTGADIGEMSSRRDRPERLLDELTLASHATVEAVRHAPKPVVAAVNGIAAGGGLGLALAADLIVMGETARFVVAFGNLGVSPDCGSTAALTQVLGVYRAREAVLIDEGIDARKAQEWGLVNRVVAPGEVLAEARRLAQIAGARSRHTIVATKMLVDLARHAPLEVSLEAERRAIIAGSQTPDFQEGLDAFLDKRRPRFRGQSMTVAGAPKE